MNQELHNAANEYCLKYQQSHGFDTDDIDIYDAFVEGAERALNHLWKDAQGDDLPPIDREVIVIDKRGKVSYGHRPDPNRSYIGKSVIDGNKMKYKVMTYGKGKWNIPDVKYWLDVELPNMEKQQ